MKKTLCLTILLFLYLNFCPIQSVFSQDFIDLINVGVDYSPVNKYEGTDSSFKYRQDFINIQVPVVFKNKDVFLPKISLNQYTISDNENFEMYICYLQLGYLKNLGKETSLRMAIFPKIASQFKDVDIHHFLVPALAVLQYKQSEKLSYGLGLTYSKEFFGHFVNPAIYIKWRFRENWEFYCDYPSHGYLMYRHKESFNTGIYLSSSTTSIRLSNKYNGAYIQKAYANLSLFFDINFTKSFVMRVKGGYSTMRSLDMYAKDDTVPFTLSLKEFGDNRTQLNKDINDAAFFEISLNYRYHY